MFKFRLTLAVALIYAVVYFSRSGIAPTSESFRSSLPFGHCTSGKQLWLEGKFIPPVIYARFVPMSIYQVIFDLALLALLEETFWTSDTKVCPCFWPLFLPRAFSYFFPYFRPARLRLAHTQDAPFDCVLTGLCGLF